MSLSSFLLFKLFFQIVISYEVTEACSACTTATLLDLDGYKGYNASAIDANPTATTYFLACVPQFSGDCNNDGITVNLTAINGPSTAGLIVIDTQALFSWEWKCPVTGFSISSCTYTATGVIPSGSSDTQGLGSGTERETLIQGPTTQSDSRAITDGISEITPVVVLVTGGVEKLATLSKPATATAITSESRFDISTATSGSGLSTSSCMKCSAERVLTFCSIGCLVGSTPTTPPKTSSQSVATQASASSSSQGAGKTSGIGKVAIMAGVMGMIVVAL